MDTNPNDDTRASCHKDDNAPEQQDVANGADTADAAQDEAAPLPVPPPCSTTSYSNGFASTDGRNFVSYTYRYDGSPIATRLAYDTYTRDTAGSNGATTAEDTQAATDTEAIEPDIETWFREWDRLQNEATVNLRARQQDPPMQ